MTVWFEQHINLDNWNVEELINLNQPAWWWGWSSAWWSITWDITSQTDLQSALNNKANQQLIIDNNSWNWFVDNKNISRVYDPTTRKITLSHTSWVRYYYNWVEHNLWTSWTSDAHDTAFATYFLYSTDWTTISWSTNVWTFFDVMFWIWNYQSAYKFWLSEVHWMEDPMVHQEFHKNISTYRKTDTTFLLTAWSYTVNTATDSANSPSFDWWTLVDEDLETVIASWTKWTYTTMYVWASSVPTFNTTATLPFISAGSYIQYNNVATGALVTWQNNRFYNVYQLLIPVTWDTDSQKYRMVMLQPQAEYTSLALAQAESVSWLSLWNLGNELPEFVIFARITYTTANTDNNTWKCRIATWWISYVLWSKAVQINVSWFNWSNHQLLSNLSWSTSWHTDWSNNYAWFNSSWTATTFFPPPIPFDNRWVQILQTVKEIVICESYTLLHFNIALDTLPVWQSFKVDLKKNSSGSVLSAPLEITTTEWLTNNKYLVMTWDVGKATITSPNVVKWDILYVEVTQLSNAPDLNLIGEVVMI